MRPFLALLLLLSSEAKLGVSPASATVTEAVPCP
jgi:hypothetical protein